VIPLRVSTAGVGGDGLKWSVRLVDAQGSAIAMSDRALGPDDQFGLFVPPGTIPGLYSVVGVAYDPQTLAPLTNEDGQEAAHLFDVTVSLP
jgi:hypothetical protein